MPSGLAGLGLTFRLRSCCSITDTMNKSLISKLMSEYGKRSYSSRKRNWTAEQWSQWGKRTRAAQLARARAEQPAKPLGTPNAE